MGTPTTDTRVTKASERTVRASVIDRLIDHEPRQSGDPGITFAESVRRYKESVLRDLEWLLNTRRTIVEVSDALEELRRSVFVFGLPDISSVSSDSDAARHRLLRDVEECIRLGEPRLTGIRLTPVEDTEASQRRVRFVIEGLLRMEPNPERVVFDTVLDIASGEIELSGVE